MNRPIIRIAYGVAIAVAAISCGGVRGSVAQAPPPSPQASGRSGADAHAYFDALAARPEKAFAYSLRDQAQLDKYVHGRPPSSDITYDPAHDTYPLAQDAAKVVLAPDAGSIRKQVRVPIPVSAGKTLITWDAWWGAEFRTDNGGMLAGKTFQIASHLDNSERFLEIRARYQLSMPPNVCSIDMRAYGRLGSNVTRDAPVSPQRDQFQVAPNTWTRFWVEFEIVPDGFDRVSMWVADEKHGPVQLLDRREIESAGSLTTFWLEYNSSSNRRGGPLVAYVRNLVVLHDVANPTSLFQRPAKHS